jgi:hypothetical protein
MDMETGSERSFCPLEPRRQVLGARIDESLGTDGVVGFQCELEGAIHFEHLDSPKYLTKNGSVRCTTAAILPVLRSETRGSSSGSASS